MTFRTSAFVAVMVVLACTPIEATAIGRLKQTFALWTGDRTPTVRFPDSFEVGWLAGQRSVGCGRDLLDVPFNSDPAFLDCPVQVAYTYSLPYVETYQSGGLR